MFTNDQHDFFSIFKVHSKNPSATQALQILKPHFPLYTQTRGIVDIRTLHRNGGTFLSNWNLVPREANCAIRVLSELAKGGHDCFFIVPVASPDGFPDAVVTEMNKNIAICMRLLVEFTAHPYLATAENLSKIPLPPYFSVHTFSRSVACVDAYRETAMACVLEDIPDIALHPEIVSGSEEFTETYLKGFTLGNKG
jgi:hypothetical protein